MARRPVSVAYVAPGWDAATVLSGVVTFGDTSSAEGTGAMVDAILEDADRAPISRLRIIGHGFRGGQQIGPDLALTSDNFETHRAELARLRGHFTRGAVVELEGCDVGDGPNGARLLAQLATLWGVEVRAGTVPQRLPPGLEGTVAIVRSTPRGAVLSYDESSLDAMHRYRPFDGQDEKAMRAVRTETSESMRTMSEAWRFRMIRRLASGDMTQEERRAALAVWESASPAERRSLYFYFEHRNWPGGIRELPEAGIVRKFDTAERARLTELLNETL